MILILILLFLLLNPCYLFGVEDVDSINAIKPGVVEKNLEQKDKNLRFEKKIPLFDKEISRKQDIKSDSKLKIMVLDFQFSGNTIFSDKYLDNLVKNYKEKKVTIKRLNDICRKITGLYRKKGYIFDRAYLPIQKIKGGIVLIRIKEIRFGNIKIRGQKFYTKNFVSKHFNDLKNKNVNYNLLLKKLLIINEYPNIYVESFFEKNDDPDKINLSIEVKDSRLIAGYIEYNNFGSRYVSEDRAILGLNYGDFINIRTIIGDPIANLNYISLATLFPISSHGTKLKLSYDKSSYKVGEPYEFLDMKGESNIFRLETSHPLIRSRKQNLDAFIGFDYKSTKNYTLSYETSNDELRILKTGIKTDYMHNSSARTFVNITFSQGIPSFMGGLAQTDPNASRAGAGGEFSKLNIDITRLEKTPIFSYLILKSRIQLNSKNLTSGEQLSIGGYTSVRGYPESTYLGDSGYILNLEQYLTLTSGKSIKLKIFCDYGNTEKNSLLSSGLGLDFKFLKRFNGTIDFGVPVNDKENRQGILYLKLVAGPNFF